IFVLIAAGAYVLYQHRQPPPSGSPNDQTYRQERVKRQPYSETEGIQACSESAANCYSLTADLDHEFDSHRHETVYVRRIYFPNGGWLDFGNATIPGSGTDKRDNTWSFGWQ